MFGDSRLALALWLAEYGRGGLGRWPTAFLLDVMVEEFVGVEIGAVGWQQDQAVFFGLLRQPTLHRARLLYRMGVHNQINILSRVAYEPAEKIDEDHRRKTSPEHHEAQRAALGDRTDNCCRAKRWSAPGITGVTPRRA